MFGRDVPYETENHDKAMQCWRDLGCAIVYATIKETQKFCRYRDRARMAPPTKRNRNLVKFYSREVCEHVDWLMGDECHLFCGHRFTPTEIMRICSGELSEGCANVADLH